ncbi:MAG: adenosylhomocysteinase [Clostridia bacterium]
MAYSIRDISLAPEGKRKIDWVTSNMPILSRLEQEYGEKQVFKGVKVAICVHLEAKTAYLGKVFKNAGAQVRVTGSNPLSTKDDVCAALAKDGVEVFAWHNASSVEYQAHLRETLSFGPNIIIDDGGDLVSIMHEEMQAQLADVYGGCEETTTGILRLRAMEKEKRLQFPMVGVNEGKCKHLFDNRYGTGQSVWDGILRTTNLNIAGKSAVVVGYGWCGKGIALRARGLGANVIITEIDPVKACEAVMDGYLVMPMDKACTLGDVFITATGCKEVITTRHFTKMKDGALLANAGHFNVEVSVEQLENIAVGKTERRQNITGYRMPGGSTLNLLGEGRLVNLACADGHPAEIMDMSFSLQLLCAKHILDNKGRLKNRLYGVPDKIDDYVARKALEGMGVKIDRLTRAQKEYLNSWKI